MKNLSNEAVNLLRHNARSIVRELGLLNDAYFEIGVTLAERHLLIELTSLERPTAGEIAKCLLIDKSTVSRLIAKAVKKGFVKCSSDENDKRKQVVELTEAGKKTLNAFEPIAFRQTKEALLTLTAQEMETVHQGIALYAKGLKNARLQNNAMQSIGELGSRLSQLGYTLEPMKKEDEKGLYEIFQQVVDAGNLFPYENSSMEEFQRQFFGPQSHVYVCRCPEKNVIGGFYIRPNYSGRSRHIANAAYMIRSTHRGQGIGTLLVKSSLPIAKSLGFQTMQFNMVLSQNIAAVKLYQKLGFTITGTLPQAVRNPDGSYQDGYIMHRKLEDL